MSRKTITHLPSLPNGHAGQGAPCPRLARVLEVGHLRNRGILGGMPPAPKLSKSERAAARLKKKKTGPSAVKRATARQALQTKKPADEAG